MVALISVHTSSWFESAKPADMPQQRRTVVVAACLFVSLVFATSTVFVRDSWALQIFQMFVFTLLGVYVLFGISKLREQVAKGIVPSLVYMIPLWGIAQILAHTTVYAFQTQQEVFRWGALAGVFFLCQVISGSISVQRGFLLAFMGFATLLALLCLIQLFTSQGKVLWMFPTGYDDVYGTFPNRDNYTQFIELALPIALWNVCHAGRRAWWYVVAAGLLYGSVIGAASRAGTILCSAELMTFLFAWSLTLSRKGAGSEFHARAAILLAVPLFALAFSTAVGWQRIVDRFKDDDPLRARRELLIAAVAMAKDRPLMGHGLGTFPEVYQKFAIKTFPFYANHAHDDWAEFAADGGLPFLILVLVPFAVIVPTACRHPWGLGLVAVMAHACIDFPFPRPAVSGWMFALLGFLFMARRSDKHDTANRPGDTHSERIETAFPD